MNSKPPAARQRKPRSSHRLPPVAHSRQMPRRLLLAFLFLAIGGGALGWLRVGSDDSLSLEPPAPPDLERLEPAVAALVRTHLRNAQDRPRSAAAFGELGLVYEANKLWGEARASFALATRLAPENELWRLHLAVTTQKLGDFPTALQQLRALVADHPDFAAAQQQLGHALLETGELPAAAAAFQQVMRLKPQAPEGYVGLADTYLRQADVARAAPLLEHALTLDSRYQVAHYLLGTAYARLGRESDAARHRHLGLDAQVRYLPDSLTPRLGRYAVNAKARTAVGVREMAAGQIDRAITTFEQILQTDPANVTVLNNLAGAYAQRQRFEEAHQLLIRARRIDPRKHSTYINLTNWAVATGQPEQALQFADQAVSLAPISDVAHRTRALVLERLGRFEAALDDAQRACELNPRDPRLAELCADYCVRLRRYEAARQHYQRSADLAPRRLEAWLGLCQTQLVLGQADAARTSLANARHLAPDDRRVVELSRRMQIPSHSGN